MHHGKMTLWGKKNTPSAQWFIDPDNPSRMRWWDGSGWTEHCAPIPPGDRAAGTSGLPAARVAGRAVSAVVATPAQAATHAAPVSADEDPSDILRRMLREMEWTDLDKWPLDEQVEVAGEQFYAKEIRKLFVECGLPITAAGVSVENEPCFLVPEPWNPHDPNAVAVMVRKYHVGHLPADLARRYHPRLIAYAQRRQLVTGVARVWSRLESGAMVRARVTIVVPEIAVLLASTDTRSSPASVPTNVPRCAATASGRFISPVDAQHSRQASLPLAVGVDARSPSRSGPHPAGARSRALR